MFATYGEFVFETIFSPEQFQSTRDYNYAEHKVVEDISRLQWVGDDTEELDLQGLFHFTFCNPKSEIEQLYAAAEDHKPRALIYGSGEFRGYFVIEEIVADYQQFSGDGVLEATRFQLKLKGFPLKELFDHLTPPPLGHQPWGIIQSDQPNRGGQPEINSSVAVATFGYVPTSGFSPSITLPVGGEGVSAITSNQPPTGPPAGNFNVLDISPATIVRSE